MTSPLSRFIFPWTLRKSIKSRADRPNLRSHRTLRFEGMEERRLLAVMARVVEDSVPLGGINNGDFSSAPSAAVDVGGTAYFSADDGVNGLELWRVNTSGFAELVDDSIAGGGIASGNSSSNPTYLSNFNGTLYFSASDGVNGTELWRVNTAGVAELVPGSVAGGINPGSNGSDPSDFTIVGTSLYFVAIDNTNGKELRRLGTTGVVQLVEDSISGGGLNPGSSDSSPKYLTNVSGQLFFRATNSSVGDELWRVPTGGLASVVEDSIAGGGIAPGNEGSYPMNLLNFGGTLYFAASNSANGTELWRVSGSSIAQLVEDSIAGGGLEIGSGSSYPSELATSSGTLYFQANNAANGTELWRINTGGVAQVVQVAGSSSGGINPGASSAVPTNLTNASGTLYFQATTDSNGYELWRVNSVGEAELVEDNQAGIGIAPGTANATPLKLTNVNGTLYFSADDGSRGRELWRVPSTGVAEIVEDNLPGGGIAIAAESSYPSDLMNVSGKLFFSARNAAQGTELWQIDASGIANVVENGISGDGLSPGTGDSNPAKFSMVNGKLYFSANNGLNGLELWRIKTSVATAISAEQISVAGSTNGIARNSSGSDPENLTLLNGTLFFAALDNTNGRELWKLNNLGVAEIIEDSLPGGGLQPGVISSNPRDMTSVSGTVYFSADAGTSTGLWRIDSSGLAQLVFSSLSTGGIEVILNKPHSSLLTNVNGTLYFVAADNLNGNELWRIGTAGSAEIVEDVLPGGGLNPGASSSNPNALANVNGTLYFVAKNLAAGEELWQVTGSGTAELVEDSIPGDGIYPSAGSSLPSELTNFGGTLYFQANDGTNGKEIWRVGTSGLAELVEVAAPQGGINAGFVGSYPSRLTTSNGTLYFQANDGTTGIELWRIPNSGIASQVLASGGGDINPGRFSSNPKYLTDVSGTLYFQGQDGVNGYELFRVNALGNAQIVEDAIPGGGIRPGNATSAPNKLKNLNGTLYFEANDGTNGKELWRVNSSGVAELVEDTIAGGGIAPGSDNSNIDNLTAVGGSVFFTAEDVNRGRELFTMNNLGIAVAISGEDGGNEILPGATSSNPKFLTNVNGALYFSADSGSRFGVELMQVTLNTPPTLTRTNATVSGTVLAQLVNSGTWNDADGDAVILTASLGNIVKNLIGTWDWNFTPTSKLINQVVQITATDTTGGSSSVSFLISADVKVVNRQVFYNRSQSTVFGNGSGNPLGSIDSSKSALLPGQSASFANYTNYRLGLNGLVVDVAGLGAGATAADFQFATWNGIAIQGFAATPILPTLTFLSGSGVGGSTRVKIEFPNNAIQNTWLRITLLGNANTDLAANDIFYFGSAIGEMNVGNLGSPALIRVDESDLMRVRQNQSPAANSVLVTNIFDLNKDGRVNGLDLSILRQYQKGSTIKLFTAPLSLQIAPMAGSRGMVILSVPRIENTVLKNTQVLMPIDDTYSIDRYFASFK